MAQETNDIKVKLFGSKGTVNWMDRQHFEENIADIITKNPGAKIQMVDKDKQQYIIPLDRYADARKDGARPYMYKHTTVIKQPEKPDWRAGNKVGTQSKAATQSQKSGDQNASTAMNPDNKALDYTRPSEKTYTNSSYAERAMEDPDNVTTPQQKATKSWADKATQDVTTQLTRPHIPVDEEGYVQGENIPAYLLRTEKEVSDDVTKVADNFASALNRNGELSDDLFAEIDKERAAISNKYHKEDASFLDKLQGKGPKNGLNMGRLNMSEQEARELRNNAKPETILNKIQPKVKKVVEDYIKNNDVSKLIHETSKRYGISTEDVTNSISSQLYNRLYDSTYKKLVALNMPKDDIEYVLSGINNTILGTVYRMYSGKSALQKQIEAEAEEASIAEHSKDGIDIFGYKLNAVNFGREAVSFVDPFFGLTGKASMYVVKKIAMREINNLVRKGFTKEVAQRMIAEKLEHSMGKRVLNGMVQRGVGGGVNLGTYNFVSEATQQAYSGEFDPEKLLERTTSGAGTGIFLSLGGLLGGTTVRVGLKGGGSALAKRATAQLGGFLTEAMLFTGATEAEKYLTGNANKIEIVPDLMQSIDQLIAMKVAGKATGGMHGEMGGKGSSGKSVLQKTKDAVRAMFEPIETETGINQRTGGVHYTKDEQEHLKTIPSYRNMIAKLNALREKGTTFKKPDGTKEKVTDEMVTKQMAEFKAAYNEFIHDKNVTFAEKQKFHFVFNDGQRVCANLPVACSSDVIDNGDGTMIGVTYDDQHNVIQRYKFKGEGNTLEERQANAQAQSDMFVIQQKRLVESNRILEMEGKYPEQAAMARQNLLKMGYSQEQLDAAIPQRKNSTSEQMEQNKTTLQKGMDAALADEIKARYAAQIAYLADIEDTYTPDFHTQQGYTLQGGERHNAIMELNKLQEGLSDGTPDGEEFRRQVEAGIENPADALYQLANSGYTPEQIAKATRYYNQKAKVDAMLEHASRSVDAQVEQANSNVRNNTHKESGNVITLSDNQGHQYYVLSGRYGYDPETGRSLKSECDQTLVVRDAETGELEIKNPQELYLVSVNNPEDLIYNNETTLRNTITERLDNEMSYAEGTPTEPVLGDTYVGRDGKTYMIEAVNGMPAKIELDEEGKPTKNVLPVDMEEYMDSKSAELDAQAEAERQAQAEAERQQQAELVGEEPSGETEGTVAEGAEANTAGDENSQQEPVAEGLAQTPEQLARVSVNGNVTQIHMTGGLDGYWMKGNLDNPEGQFKFGYFDKEGNLQTEDFNVSEIESKKTFNINEQPSTAAPGNQAAEQPNMAAPGSQAAQQPEAGPQITAEEALRQQELAEGEALAKRQEKLLKEGLVGYDTGNPDLLHPNTKPEAAAEYLIKQNGGDEGKAIKEAQAQLKAAGEEVEKQKTAIDQETKYVNAWGDTMTPDEEQQHKDIIAQTKEALAEAQRVQKRWQQIHEAMMTPEAKAKIKQERHDNLEKKKAEGYKESEATYTNSKPTEGSEGLAKDENGHIIFSKSTPEAIDQHVDNNYTGYEEDYLKDKKLDLRGESETIEIEKNRLAGILNEYENGEGQLTDEAAEGIAREIGKLTQRQSQIMDEKNAINEAEKRLANRKATLEAERRRKEEEERYNKLTPEEKSRLAEYNKEREKLDEAKDKRKSILNAIVDPIKKLMKAREIYAGTEGEPYLDDASMEPETPLEYVSNLGAHVLAWDSYMQGDHKVRGAQEDLGLKRGIGHGYDTNGINYFLAPKGQGKGIEELTQELYEGRPNPEWTDQDIRNALIEMLGSVKNAKDAKNMILNSRIERAEEALSDMEDGMLDQEYSDVLRYSKKNTSKNRKKGTGKMQTLADRRQGAGDRNQTSETSGTEQPSESENMQAEEPKTSAEELEVAKEETDTNPTEAQKEAGNYKKGHIKAGDLDVTVENPAGSVRSGKDKNGNEWSTTMHYTYGYIRGRKGADGDHVDIIVNDAADLWHWNGKVYVVDQKNDDGTFDEHKVMYGFDSMEEATQAYLSNYEPGWESHVQAVTGVDREHFHEWLNSSDKKLGKPFAETPWGRESRYNDLYKAFDKLRAEQLKGNHDIQTHAVINMQMNAIRREMRAMGIAEADIPKMDVANMGLDNEGLGAYLKANAPELTADINELAKQVGVKFILVTPEQFKKENPKAPDVNGQWDPDTNKLYVLINSDDVTPKGLATARGQIVKAVFGHEMNHKNLEDKDFKAQILGLAEPLIEKYYNRIKEGEYQRVYDEKKKDYEKELAKERAKIKLNNPDATPEQIDEMVKAKEKEYIHEEMFGDITGEAMLNKNFVSELIGDGKNIENPSTLGKLRTIYRDFKNKIRNFKATDKEKEIIEIQKLIRKAYLNSVKAQVEKANAEAEKSQTSQTSGTGQPKLSKKNYFEIGKRYYDEILKSPIVDFSDVREHNRGLGERGKTLAMMANDDHLIMARRFIKEEAKQYKGQIGNAATGAFLYNATVNGKADPGIAKEISDAIVSELKDYNYQLDRFKNVNAGKIDPSVVDEEISDVNNAIQWYNEFGEGKHQLVGDHDDAGIRFSKKVEDSDPFYSNAANAVEGIKQGKATPEQWLKMIEKAGGLKKEEDKWMGLSDWLKGQDKRTLTREEVENFIAENAVKVEEVHYGDIEDKDADEVKQAIYNSPEFEGIRAELIDYDEDDNPYINKSEFDKLASENNDFRYGFNLDYWGEDLEIDDPLAAARYLGIAGYDEKPINDTRLTYTTEGLKHNKEIALTVPTVDSYYGSLPEVHFADDYTKGKTVAWVRFGEATTHIDGYHEAIVMREKARKAYWDFEDTLREKYHLSSSDYQFKGISAEDRAELIRLRDEYKDAASKAERQNFDKKVLVIDEIQSQRHQDGREKGYDTDKKRTWREVSDELAEMRAKVAQRVGKDKNYLMVEDYTPEEWEAYDAKYKEMEALVEENDDKSYSVPDAPFRANWHELGMKRMLRYAAENDYDMIAWTTGAQQAKRYGLGSVVDHITAGIDLDGNRSTIIYMTDGTRITYDHDAEGNITHRSGHAQAQLAGAKHLADVIGKDLTAEILAQTERGYSGAETYDGDDLLIGGEGMKGFYDNMLVKFMNKYGKKWGVKVGTVELYDVEDDASKMWSVDVTPEMKESVMEGQPMFSKKTIRPSGEAEGEEPAVRYSLIGKKGALSLDEFEKYRDKQLKRIAKMETALGIHGKWHMLEDRQRWEKIFEDDKEQRLKNLKVAQRMDESKRNKPTAETIKRATGWEKGADGQWRYEIGDATLSDKLLQNIDKVQENGPMMQGRFRDLVNAPELLEAYPELGDYYVNIYNAPNDSFYGFQRGRSIYLNIGKAKEDATPTTKQLGTVASTVAEQIEGAKQWSWTNTLNHEIQHCIQEIEGFAQGGNKNSVHDILQKIRDEHKYLNDADMTAINLWTSDSNRAFEMHRAEYLMARPSRFLKSGEHFKYSGSKAEIIEQGQKLAAKDYYDGLMMLETVANRMGIDLAKYGLDLEKMSDDLDAMEGRGMTPMDVARTGYMIKEMQKFYDDVEKIQDKRIKENQNLEKAHAYETIDKALRNVWEDYELYRRLAGEVEARAVGSRVGMTQQERRESPSVDSEDVKRNQQLPIRNNNILAGGIRFSKKATDKGNTVEADEDGSVRFSFKTEQDPENKKLVEAVANTYRAQWVNEDLDKMLTDTDDIIKQIMPLLDIHPDFMVTQNRTIALNSQGKPIYNVFFANHDTEAPTIEFSTNCVKKEAMNNLMEVLKQKGILHKLNEVNLDTLLELLEKHGYSIPCKMCFVEARRNMIHLKEDFVDKWNKVADIAKLGKDYVTDGVNVPFDDKRIKILEAYIAKNGSRTMPGRIAQMMIDYPELRGRFNKEDLLTASGYEDLWQRFGETPLTGMLEGLAGAASPKPTFDSHPFDQRMFDARYTDMRPYFGLAGIMNGGFRSRSFSDADPNLFVDEIQMRRNLVITKSGMFGYTKVPYMVDLFGETGEFHNMSLVVEIDPEGEPYTDKKASEQYKHAGLIRVGDPRHQKSLGLTDEEYEEYKKENNLKDGDWDYYFSQESFPVRKALAFRNDPRFGGRVGTILLVTSDEMMEKALDDDRIDMIIGYHSSGKGKESKEKVNYDLAKDYTGLNETKGSTKADTKNYLPSLKMYAPTYYNDGIKGIDFNYDEACQTLRDPRLAAQAYLEWCDINGFTPKYEQHRGHRNYYKLLENFRRIDNEGKPVMMEPLEMKLPKDWATRLDTYLTEREGTTAKNNEIAHDTELMKDVQKALGTRVDLTSAKLSKKRDQEYMDAIMDGDDERVAELVKEAAKEAMPNSKIVDENGNLLPVYHQTNRTVFINKETGENWDDLDWREKDEWEDRDDWDEYWEEQDFYKFDDRYGRQSIEIPGFFFAPEYDEGHEYGDRTIKAYLNITNPIINPEIPNRGVTNTAGRDAMEEWKRQGYDGMIRTDENGKPYEYAAFYPNQIKSADDITYDDAGNEIPLSERFNDKEEDIRFSKMQIPKDVPMLDDRIDGTKMIREGRDMRLAEVISNDRGSETLDDRAGFALKGLSAQKRDDLSLKIAAISNGTISDMKKRADKAANLKAKQITPEAITVEEFKQTHPEGTTIKVEDDGMYVDFGKKSREKVFVTSDVNRLGVAKNFDNLLEGSIYLYSQHRTGYDDTHVDGSMHKEHQDIYEYRNYLNRINIKGEGDYFVRFTVQRSENGSNMSHGVKLAEVSLIKIPQHSDLSSLRGRQVIAKNAKEFDAKLQNFFDIANNNGQISAKKEHLLPFIDENGHVTDSLNYKPKSEESDAADLSPEMDAAFKLSKRTKPAPKKTVKVYKLMRLGDDGELHALYIDGGAPIKLGTWYDADSPSFEVLRDLPSGNHLIDLQTGKVIKSQTADPGKAAIVDAENKGQRWMCIVPATAKSSATRASKQYAGQARQFYNWGINGSGGATTYALRPGWHASSLPVMDQIGSTAKRNIRDDRFVWVEGEISFDKDYQKEAESNPSGENDIPFHIPEDGAYMKGTSNMVTKGVTWWIAGSFKPERIIGDREARKVVDNFNDNEKDPDAPNMHYDWPRMGGRVFDADKMQLIDGTPEEVHYWERARDAKGQKTLVGGRQTGIRFSKRTPAEEKEIWDEAKKDFPWMPEYQPSEEAEGTVAIEDMTADERRKFGEDLYLGTNRRMKAMIRQNAKGMSPYDQNRMAEAAINTLYNIADTGARNEAEQELLDKAKSMLSEDAVRFSKKQEKTPQFKKWFGDWEKDPENASKVVDENGEPMVVYHGTPNYGFTIFDTRLDRTNEKDNVGSHFGDAGTAEEFRHKNNPVYAVYLNIRKPWNAFDFFADNYNNAYLDALDQLKRDINTPEGDKLFEKIKKIYPLLTNDIIEQCEKKGFNTVFDNDEGLEDVRQQPDDFQEHRNEMVKLMRTMLKVGGYDGIRYQNWYEGDGQNDCWVALEPNQIKSATDNNGDFSAENPDIRYSKRMDDEYEKAVKEGDKARATELYEQAKAASGYNDDNSWRMTHRAPTSKYPEYQLVNSSSVPSDYWLHPEWYANGPEDRESMRIIRPLLEKYKKLVEEGKQEEADAITVDVYRGVDKSKNSKEGGLRAGDWVTPSKAYAHNEALKSNNGGRVIKETVKLKDLYFNGDSASEMGWDDGNSYVYKDTKNNRKLDEVVTYDDEGNLIPLSKRFNTRNPDIRYSKRVPKRYSGESDEAYRQRIEMLQRQERRQDEITKQALINRISQLVDDQNLTAINRRSLQALLRSVQLATANKSETFFRKAELTVQEMNTKAQQRKIDKMLALKTQDVNGKNMSIAKNVSDDVREIFDMLRGKVTDLKISGYESDMTDLRRRKASLAKEIADLQGQIDRGELNKYQEDDALNDIEENKRLIEQCDNDLAELKEIKEEVANAKLNMSELDLNDELEELEHKLEQASSGEYKPTRADYNQWQALQIMKEYQEVVRLRTEANRLKGKRQSIEDTIDNLEALDYNSHKFREWQSYDELIKDIEDQIDQRQYDIIAELDNLIKVGKAQLKTNIEKELERRKELVHDMWQDVGGKHGADLRKLNQKDLNENEKENPWKKFFTAQLGSFEYMAGAVGQNSTSRNNWFYKRFVLGREGVKEADNTYLRAMAEDTARMDAKCQELFGKDYLAVMKDESKKVDHTGIFITEEKAGIPVRRELSMSRAQATYQYMVWQMAGGKAKMMNMGYTEETMAQIREFIGDQNADWAHWVQEEFLPELRTKFNDKYVEMYNTSMARIEHYVPLKISKADIWTDSDLSEDSSKNKKSLTTKTGSLINRTNNLLPIDETINAFELIMSHVDQMEEWNAFARVRKDLDYVLSNRGIRNQMNANRAGQWIDMMNAAAIATHVYQPNAAEGVDNIVAKLTKGIAGGNIAWRYNTALKQTLSVPAFYGYSQNPKYTAMLTANIIKEYGLNALTLGTSMTLDPLVGLASGTVGKLRGKNYDSIAKTMFKRGADGKHTLISPSMSWCLQNVPGFKERVLKGTAGNYLLDDASFGKYLDSYLERGMVANQMVDAITCSIGIKTIYDFKYGQLKDEILKDKSLTDAERKAKLAEAHRLALAEADIYYNGTQQSNDAMFLSPMQMSRSMIDRALSLYQNASIGYSRKFAISCQDLWKMRHWNDFKQRLIDEGMTEEQANKRMRADLVRSATGFMLYGFGLNRLWDLGGKGLLGLFAGSSTSALFLALQNQFLDADEKNKLEFNPLSKEGLMRIGNDAKTSLFEPWRDDQDDDKTATGQFNILTKEGAAEGIRDIASFISLPMRGQPGMNTLSSFVSGTLSSPLLFYDVADEFKRDATNIVKDPRQGLLSLEMAGLVGNKMLRLGGIDMNTWTNMVLAGKHFAETRLGWDDTNKMIDIMLFLNTPNSGRKLAAKNLYMSKSVEEYRTDMIKAMKLLDDVDDSWAARLNSLTGLKSLTKEKEDMIYDEWNFAHMTPEEQTKVKADKDMKKQLDELTKRHQIREAYEKETNPEMKVKLASRLKAEYTQEQLSKMTPKQRAEERRNMMLGKTEFDDEKPNNIYIGLSNSQDIIHDAALAEAIKKFKPIYDEYDAIEDPDKQSAYYDRFKEYIDKYEDLTETRSEINSLKNGMKESDTQERLNSMNEIRKIRSKALGIR